MLNNLSISRKGADFKDMFSDAAARITRLKTLNNILISDVERRGAEYDLLKIYGPKMAQAKHEMEKQNLFKECRALSVIFKSNVTQCCLFNEILNKNFSFALQNMDHPMNYSLPLQRFRMSSTLKYKLFRSQRPWKSECRVKLPYKHCRASFWNYSIQDAANSRDWVMSIRKIRTFAWNWTKCRKV